jgi:hypothetical protein
VEGWLFSETARAGGKLLAGAADGRDVLRWARARDHDLAITAISRDVEVGATAQIEERWARGDLVADSKEMLLFSRSALFGAVMLGLAAAGETMAITMVIGTTTGSAHRSSRRATMSSLLP